MTRHINIPIFIPHLGCPFNCIFCNQKKIASTSLAPDPKDIKRIINTHLHTIDNKNCIVEVAFFGGSFTAIDKELQIEYLKAVSSFIHSGEVEGVRVSTRPDCIDVDTLEILKRYGVKTIELGVQSLSDEVLKKSCRGYKADDVFKASHLIKEHNIKLGIQLMIGLPGDNYEVDIETTKMAISLSPDMVRIYPTIVVKDTVLAVQYEKGYYTPLTLKEAIDITKDMYLLFSANKINVIRMGLHPSEDLLSEDTVLAGPFHPAFGELVQQEIFYDQAKWLLESVKGRINLSDKLFIYVNSRDMSKMIGSKRINITKLKNEFKLSKIIVKTFKLENNSIGISSKEDFPQFISTREEFINYNS